VQEALKNMNQKSVLDQVLYLPTQDGGLKMALRDIIKIEGDRNYSTFHLANHKTKVSSKTLGYFEETLQGKGFFRCHRSYIVNYHHIDKMQKDFLVLKDTSKVPISRRRKTYTKAWFNGVSED
jgi:two-component system LytT family response regulator